MSTSLHFRKNILVVGLGNHTHPGTRHNVGMMVVDSLAQRFNAKWSKNPSWQSEVAVASTTLTFKASPKFLDMHTSKSTPKPQSAIITDPVTPEDGASDDPITAKKSKPTYSVELNITFLKPLQLMNICGSSVSRAVRDLRIKSNDVLIVHDDMERDLGKISFKSYGSANGHNGIKSCMKSLGTQHFQRLRIGIGRPGDRSPEVVSRFVLGKFKPLEIQALEDLVYDKAGDEILRINAKPN